MSEDTRTQFQKDTENFGVDILLDNGIYRHLRISNKDPNESWNQWYTITTWDNELCISGDMGTLVFSRLTDMFQFFRKNRVNPQYWAEKIQTIRYGVDNPIEEFCYDTFSQMVKQAYDDHIEDKFDGGVDEDFLKKYCLETVEEYKFDLWDEIKDQVLDYAQGEGNNLTRAYDCLYTFNELGFEFTDSWEYSYTKYTSRYIWLCEAIVRAIELYDEATETKDV